MTRHDLAIGAMRLTAAAIRFTFAMCAALYLLGHDWPVRTGIVAALIYISSGAFARIEVLA